MKDWVIMVFDFITKKTIKLYHRILITSSIIALVIIIDSNIHFSEFVFTNYKVSTISSLIKLRDANLSDTLLAKSLNADLYYYKSLSHPYCFLKSKMSHETTAYAKAKMKSAKIMRFSFWSIFSTVGVFYSMFILALCFIGDKKNRSFGNIFGMTVMAFVFHLVISSLLACRTQRTGRQLFHKA